MPVAAINNLRVIAVVRNPFDRAVSMYSFLTTTACYDERIHVCNGTSLGHGRHYHLTFEEWTSYIYSPSFSIRHLLPQHPLSIRLHLMGNQLDYLRPTEHDVNESPKCAAASPCVSSWKSGGSNVANEAATAWMSTTALRENGMDDDWVLNDNGTGTRNGRLLIFRFEEMRTAVAVPAPRVWHGSATRNCQQGHASRRVPTIRRARLSQSSRMPRRGTSMPLATRLSAPLATGGARGVEQKAFAAPSRLIFMEPTRFSSTKRHARRPS